MKSVITITVEAPSRNDLNGAVKQLMASCDQTRGHINNGARIRQSSTNGDDPREMEALMGKLKWWSLGKQREQTKPKKRGFMDWFVKEAKSLYEEEPFKK